MVWGLCLPLFFGTLVQQLYVLTDSLVAGRFIGEAALAAVGNTYQITLLYQALAFGAATGVSVVVSRWFGAGEKKKVHVAVNTALLASAAFCVLLSAAGLLCINGLLRLIRTPEDVFAQSRQYLFFYTAGLLPLFLNQIALGSFTALGDAKTATAFLTLSSLANIALDVLFVVRFRLGITGIALATLLCQTVSALAALMLLRKRLKGIAFAVQSGDSPRFSMQILREMIQIALPVTIQQLIVSVGNLLIQANVNSFGTGVSAGYAAAIKMNNLAITALMAFDKGMAAFAAQNAAEKTERIRAGRNTAVLLSVFFALSIAAVFYVFRAELLGFFLRTASAEAMRSGERFILIVMPFYLFVSVKIACDGMLRGLAKMRLLLLATFADLSLRVGCGFLFSSIFGSVGIWAAWPAGWVTGSALSLIFTIRVLRKRESDSGEETKGA